MFSLIRRYVLSYWYWFFAGIFFLFLTNWAGTEIPMLMGKAIDGIRHNKPSSVVLNTVYKMMILGVVVIIVRTLSRLFFFTPARDIEFHIKNDLFKHLLALKPFQVLNIQIGEIVSRATNDITAIRVLVGLGVLKFLNIVFTVSLSFYNMFRISFSLTLFICIPMIISFVIVQMSSHKMFLLSKEVQEELAQQSSLICTTVYGVQTIQGFQVESTFEDKFNHLNDDFYVSNIKLAKIKAFVLPLLTFSTTIGMWILFAYGGSLIIKNQLSLGAFVSFISFLLLMLVPFRGIGWLISSFQKGQSSALRVLEILDFEVPKTHRLTTSKDSPLKVDFQASDLTFSYTEKAEQNVFKQLSFQIPFGSKIGILGKTGSGKTTLFHLLLGLHWAPPNQLFLNGQDINSLEGSDVRQNCSFCSQNPIILSDPIRANFAFGKTEEFSLSEDKIWEALRSVDLEEDVQKMPQQLDTFLGNQGGFLSLGQRQRLSFAIAVSRPFQWFFYDEALSVLDFPQEKKLFSPLFEKHAEKPFTMLVASRNPFLLSQMDEIWILEKGKITSKGTHKELLANHAYYQKLWKDDSREVLK